MGLEFEIFSEFIQSGQIPGTSLDDAEQFDVSQDFRHMESAKAAGDILNRGSPDRCQVFVGIPTGLEPLQAGEIAFENIWVQFPCPVVELVQKLIQGERFGTAKELRVDIFGPLFISLRNTRVPSIDKVEFCRDRISSGLCDVLAKEGLAFFRSGVEIPVAVDSVEIQDGSDVVLQDDIDVQASSYQPRSLEEGLVVQLVGVGRSRPTRRIKDFRKAASFIYPSEIFRYMVVEAVEENEQRSNARRKPKNPFVEEAVWPQPAIFEGTYIMLVAYRVAIEGS